jgi:prepilin-type N-terminal cleavage/methylation domain-containing protein
MNMKKHNSGFTLVELLMVVAIVSVIAGIGSASYYNLREQTEVSSMTERIVADMRATMSKTAADANSQQWGMHFDNTVAGQDYYTIFTGAPQITYGSWQSPALVMASDGVNMWTAGYSCSCAVKITPTGSMTTYSGLNTQPNAMAFDGVNMWTANANGTVTKISPTGVMTTYSTPGVYFGGIAFDGVNMWADDYSTGAIIKISPTGVATSIPLTGSGYIWGPDGIAFDGVNMWVANSADPSYSVTKITPTGVITTYTGMNSAPRSIAFDGTNMWVTNYNNSVTKVTPTGGMTIYTGTGTYPYSIAFDGTNMWTTNAADPNSTVTKISPTGQMTTYSGVGWMPSAITFDGANMWVINGTGTVTEIPNAPQQNVDEVSFSGTTLNFTNPAVGASTNIIFTKPLGLPLNSATITIANPKASHTITIDTNGTINF